MSSLEELTDEQWAIIEPLIPSPPHRADGRGRPIEHDDRAVLNGMDRCHKRFTAFVHLAFSMIWLRRVQARMNKF
jgi:putative transposase of IS4/5 family DUF4096